MPETIFDLISENARNTPEAPALLAPGRADASYARLQRRIIDMVERLNAIGVGRGDRVAIVLPSGPEAAIASLGVMAGAAAAPLNPEFKHAESEFLLSRLQPKLLLALAGQGTPARAVAEKMGIPILEISPAPGAEAGAFELTTEAPLAATERGGPGGPDDIALVLHTSGTSALPRTVPLSHRNLAASARNMARSLELGPADRCLHMLPMFHIGALIDVLAAPLVSGGSVICTNGFSTPEFFRCLAEARPTWSQAVPTMLQDIVDHAAAHSGIIAGNTLRLMRSVSAPLPVALLEAFESTFGVPVIEIYGMTETAGLITSNPIGEGLRRPGSVGLPAGPEVRIVDAAGDECQSGEVVVRGANVMAGYLDAPAENARGFFGDWFRTGDEGHLDDDGHLHLTGRLKEIINRGGEKISPREVDDLLLDHSAVADAATFAVPHASLGEEVAAAIVLKPGAALSRQQVIDYLQPRLAYYKVPRVVHFLDRIPKTRGGKLQRYKLSEELGAVVPEAAGSGQAYIPPESPVAKAIAAMWARVLEVPRVGLQDDFFELGGDSLRGASFINEIQQTWGETVYVSALFDASVLDRFEAHLREAYPELVVKILGRSLSPGVAAGRVDAEKLAGFREMIPRLGGGAAPARDKNPKAVFVLTTPRSGSTLLRAMLGGNSRLFAPPELYLLNFDTLADRKDWFKGTQRHQLEGNTRAVMQIKGQTLEEARDMLEGLEARALPAQEYYRMMQSWLGDRILVDKTPFYAIDVETLQRAEDWFEDPLYLHLTRHPYGMIRSFEEARLEQLWYPRLVGVDAAERQASPYRRREMAEMIWLTLHENILQFLDGVPEHRRHRVAFEELVSAPQETMVDLSAFLGLDYEPGMIAPHDDPSKRMTDGIHPVSRMIGDMKFHQHRTIDAGVAELWKDAYDTDFLSDEAWRVAAVLGHGQTIAAARDRKEFVL